MISLTPVRCSLCSQLHLCPPRVLDFQQEALMRRTISQNDQTVDDEQDFHSANLGAYLRRKLIMSELPLEMMKQICELTLAEDIESRMLSNFEANGNIFAARTQRRALAETRARLKVAIDNAQEQIGR